MIFTKNTGRFTLLLIFILHFIGPKIYGQSPITTGSNIKTDIADAVSSSHAGSGYKKITIDWAPENAIITKVEYAVEISHPKWEELAAAIGLEISAEKSPRHILFRRGDINHRGTEKEGRSTNVFNGLKVNNTFYFRVWDNVKGNSGSINIVGLRVYYEVPLTNPTVSLESPLSGSFSVGNTMNIRWSSTNQHHHGIYLYKGGTSSSDQIATIRLTGGSTDNNSRSYNWQVPSTIVGDGGQVHVLNGTDYRLKVVVWNSDNANVASTDHEYSGNLTISPSSTISPPTVNLESPLSGSFSVGNTMNIRWSSTNQHHHGIYLYKGGTSSSDQIATIRLTGGSTDNNSRSYNWQVPSTIVGDGGQVHVLNGTDYRLKVVVWNSDNANVASTDHEYSGNLTISPSSTISPPTVSLESPLSGSFSVGNTMNIRWSSTNQHHHGIYLYKGGTSSSDQIATIRLTGGSTDNNSRSYNWQVPSTIVGDGGQVHVLNGTDYRLKVVVWNSDNANVASTDHEYSGNLTISPSSTISPPTVSLESPLSGSFSVGNTMNIRWSSTNQHHHGIYLYKGGKEIYDIRVSPPSGIEFFDWIIPNAITDKTTGQLHEINGTDYKIKVAVWNEDGVAVGDQSDNSLTILTNVDEETICYEAGEPDLVPRLTFPLEGGELLYEPRSGNAFGDDWGLTAKCNGKIKKHTAHDYVRKDGQDIVGTEVYAALGGVVKYNQTEGGWANSITIEHVDKSGGAFTTNYNHLESSVTPGTYVQKGELVGYIADLDNSQGYFDHLHFGIRMAAYSDQTFTLGHTANRGTLPQIGDSSDDCSCDNGEGREPVFPEYFINPSLAHFGEENQPNVISFSPAGVSESQTYEFLVEGEYLPLEVIIKVPELSIEKKFSTDGLKGTFEMSFPSLSSLSGVTVFLSNAVSGKKFLTKELDILRSQELTLDIQPGKLYTSIPFTVTIQDKIERLNQASVFGRNVSYELELSSDGGDSWTDLATTSDVFVNFGQSYYSSLNIELDNSCDACIIRVRDTYYPERLSQSTPFSAEPKSLLEPDVSFEWDASFRQNPDGKPVGVAADGVSRFLVSVKMPDVDLDVESITLSLINAVGQSDPGTDGLGFMKEATVSPEEYSDEANDASETQVTILSDESNQYYVWYVAPRDFSTSTAHSYHNDQRREVNLETKIQYTDGSEAVNIAEISVVRPPLLLVHGLGGNETTWDNFAYEDANGSRKRFIDDERFVSVNAINLSLREPFIYNASLLLYAPEDILTYHNRPVISISQILTNLRSRGYVASQVDYIGHSMGGSILRAAEEKAGFYSNSQTSAFNNYGKGYIKKAITLNSPHNGSELANLFEQIVDALNEGGRFSAQQSLIKAFNAFYERIGAHSSLIYSALQPDRIGDIYQKHSIKITQAVEGLRTASAGGVRFGVTNIPSHTVAGDIVPGDFDLVNIPPELFNLVNDAKEFVDFFDDLFEVYAKMSAKDSKISKQDIKVLKSLNKVERVLEFIELLMQSYVVADFVINSDLVVTVNSQLAGKQRSSQSGTVRNVGHIGYRPVTASPEIGGIVNRLIHTPSTSAEFAPIPANNSDFGGTENSDENAQPRIKLKDDLKTELPDLQGYVEILGPDLSAGTWSGRELPLTFKLRKPELLDGYSILYSGGLLSFDNESIRNDSIKSQLLQGLSPGNQVVEVRAYYTIDDQQYQEFVELAFHVNASGQVQSLTVTPTINEIDIREQTLVSAVVQVENDLINIPLSEIEIEVSDESVLRYDNSDKLFKPLSTGEIQVFFDYQGKKDTIWFNITEEESSAGSGTIQELSLNKGWNLIGLFVKPNEAGFKELLAPLADQTVLIKDDQGSFDPALPDYLNTLSDNQQGKGYWLNVDESGTLEIPGYRLPAHTVILDLKKGWNLITFPEGLSSSLEVVLLPIKDYVQVLKNETHSYDPRLPEFLNTLTTVVPGKGYWIHVSENCVLRF